MEQAVNLFTKCLLMDTSPMVLGNDTLTDVLNGTFVTMNGNEIILLNDMGNRRVADAYLPAGFEPVGIKEYGGIIYVAAYNPITNLSQIGSFPSPLRKYSNEKNENVEISLNYMKEPFLSISIKGESSEKFLLNDSYLKKLLDIPFVPGDKFITVYKENSSITNNSTTDDSNTELTEFNLVTKSNDIKNRLYSLYYGIINSQNQFIDITNTLKLLENHHFLVNSQNEYKPWENLTLDDADLEQNRQKLDLNTYSGKLVGYPYIRVLLNHPVSFRYSYTGKRIKRQKLDKNNNPVFDDNNNPVFEEIIKLKIVATIEYNCPDFKDNTNVMIPRSNKTDIYDLNKDYKNSYGFSLYRSNYSTDEESTTNEESTTDGESTTTNGE